MRVSELFETTAGWGDDAKKIEYAPRDVYSFDDAIELIKKHCSDAMWMLNKDQPIYRGSIGAAVSSHTSIADPSKTERRSTNTSNYYTLIFDTHPEMKDFPMRARSFIASTNYDRAHGYGNYEYNNVYVLIPFNNVKIGIVNSEDIWDTTVFLFGEHIDLVQLNEVFAHMDVEETQTGIIHFFESLSKDKDLFIHFIERLEKHCFHKRIDLSDKSIKEAQSDMKKYMLDAYSPKKTGLTWATTKNMDHDLDSEVWVGGKCLVIKYSYWRKLVTYYNTSD